MVFITGFLISPTGLYRLSDKSIKYLARELEVLASNAPQAAFIIEANM